MRVILDEGVPKQLARHLWEHTVTTVPAEGWASTRNGILLELITRNSFQVFLTCDKNLEYQQHQLDRKPFGILILSTNHWPSMQPHMEQVLYAVKDCTPGNILQVQCGKFVPRKNRKPMA